MSVKAVVGEGHRRTSIMQLPIEQLLPIGCPTGLIRAFHCQELVYATDVILNTPKLTQNVV